MIVGVASFVRTGCNSYGGFARLTNAMGDWANEQIGSTPPGPQDPVASFTAGCQGLTCTFDASGSSDPDGTIASYTWNFGDGQTGSGVRPSRTYATGGTYTVELTVADNDGQKNSTTRAVTPGQAPPGTPPSASIFVFCQQANCQFDGQFSRDPDGTIVSYSWNFGDGTSGSGRLVSHAYPARAASYSVRLTVTDNSGLTDSATKTVTCQRIGSLTFCFG